MTGKKRRHARANSQVVRRKSSNQGTAVKPGGSPPTFDALERQPGSPSAADLIQLQQSVGNRAVARWMENGDSAQGQNGDTSHIQRAYFNTKVYDSGIRGKDGAKHSAGAGSQEMALKVINLSVQERAQRLKYLLRDRPVGDELDGFERVAAALAGPPEGLALAYRNLARQDLLLDIANTFSHTYRYRYLLELANEGKPSAKSQFALRLGLLHGFRLVTRKTLTDKEDILRLSGEVSAQDLQQTLNEFGGQIRQFYGRRFLARLFTQQQVKEQEGVNQPDPEQQLKLRSLYDQELAAIVEQRKHTRFQRLRLMGRTSKTKLFNDLQDWAKNKDGTVIQEIVGQPESAFRRTLAKVMGEVNITYVTQLLMAPSASVQGAENANAFQQATALLDKKQTRGVRSFKRWRQRSETVEKVNGLLFGEDKGLEEPQKALLAWHLDQQGVDAQGAQQIITLWEGGQLAHHYEAALAAFKAKLAKNSLSKSQKEKILDKFRYGAASGDAYQKIKKQTSANLWRGKHFRTGRAVLDSIQTIQPGTAEYELLRKDTELLKKIRGKTNKTMWAKIAAVLNVTDDMIDQGAGLGSYVLEGQLEQRAEQTWQGGGQPGSLEAARLQTRTWARLLDAELSSNLVNEDVVFKHIFKAQEAAWAFAQAAVLPNGYKAAGDPKEAYRDYMRAIRSSMKGNLLDLVGLLPEMGRGMAAGATLGATLLVTGTEDRGYRQMARLKQALGGDYDQRLTVGDLLNVARKRGGVSRTNVQAVEDAITALSGKELLEAWSNFPDLLREGQQVAGIEAGEKENARRHMRQLVQSVRAKQATLRDLNLQLRSLQTNQPDEGEQPDPTAQERIQELQRKIGATRNSGQTQIEELRRARAAYDTEPARQQEEERSKFAASFALKVRPEFWDKKLGGFAEFKDGNLSFRDLLKRGDRVRVERKLLNRLGDEAPKVPEFQQLAAQVMGVPVNQGPTAAIYLAQRTKAIGNLEKAQLLSTGKQWSYYSARSLIYKEAQRGYVGEFRSGGSDIAKGEQGGQTRAEAIKGKAEAIGSSEGTLLREEEAFVALRDKYNNRFKMIIMALVAAAMTALSVFTGGASFAPGFAVLFALFSSLVSSGIGALIDYTNVGEAYSHAEHIRDTVISALLSCSQALIGNVGFAIKSLGAAAIFDAGEAAYIFGRPALDIAAKLGVELTSSVVNAPLNVLNRFLQSSSLDETWSSVKSETTERIKGLPLEIVVDYFKGVVMASGDVSMGKLAEFISAQAGWKDSEGNPLQFLVQETEDPKPQDADGVGLDARPFHSDSGNIFWDPKGTWSGANQYAWQGSGLFNTGGENSGFMGLGKFSINTEMFKDPSNWSSGAQEGPFNALRVFVQAPRDALTEYLYDKVTGRLDKALFSSSELPGDKEIEPDKVDPSGITEDSLARNLLATINLDPGDVDPVAFAHLVQQVTDEVVRTVLAERRSNPRLNVKERLRVKLVEALAGIPQQPPQPQQQPQQDDD